MVPLLSLMQGLSIPRDSLGILPTPALQLLPLEQQLSWLAINSDQLVKVAQNYDLTAVSSDCKFLCHAVY